MCNKFRENKEDFRTVDWLGNISLVNEDYNSGIWRTVIFKKQNLWRQSIKSQVIRKKIWIKILSGYSKRIAYRIAHSEIKWTFILPASSSSLEALGNTFYGEFQRNISCALKHLRRLYFKLQLFINF